MDGNSKQKYVIHACPERMWYVEQYLLPSLNNAAEVVCDYDHLGNLESCMKIFSQMEGQGGAWHLQDDVIVCRDFLERTKDAEGIICGFVIQRDENHVNEGYTTARGMWWSFPCIHVPNEIARECADWYYRVAQRKYPDKVSTGKLDDWFFRKFLKVHYPDYKIKLLKPCLVDHIDYLIGGTTINHTRQETVKRVRAMWFDDQDLVDELEVKLRNT